MRTARAVLAPRATICRRSDCGTSSGPCEVAPFSIGCNDGIATGIPLDRRQLHKLIDLRSRKRPQVRRVPVAPGMAETCKAASLSLKAPQPVTAAAGLCA